MRDITHRQNCEALVALLRTTGDKVVELYGVWAGDFANVPQAHENISVDRLLSQASISKSKVSTRFTLNRQPN